MTSFGVPAEADWVGAVAMGAGVQAAMTIASPAALVASADTTMNPFIVGCTEQMYAKVPAVANVTLADAPGATSPLSNEPSLAVAVWDCAPRFVHVTVPPTGTTPAKPQAL